MSEGRITAKTGTVIGWNRRYRLVPPPLTLDALIRFLRAQGLDPDAPLAPLEVSA